MELEKRSFGGTDRTWSKDEFDRLLAIALASGRDEYACAPCLARFAGLRLHECFRIDTATAEAALRENAITIKGKGGKVRTVPIEDIKIPMTLRPLLSRTRRGRKLLVPDDTPTHIAMQRMEQFILHHRAAVQDEGSDRPLTFHGLRHTFAVLSLQNGDDVKTVQGNMGHATAAFTLDVYGHVSERMKEDSANRMQRYIEDMKWRLDRFRLGLDRRRPGAWTLRRRLTKNA